MAKIKLLPVKPKPVNDSAVEIVTDLLDRIKSGEVHTVAIAGMTSSGEITTAYSIEQGASNFVLVGAIQWLNQRIMKDRIE